MGISDSIGGSHSMESKQIVKEQSISVRTLAVCGNTGSLQRYESHSIHG